MHFKDPLHKNSDVSEWMKVQTPYLIHMLKMVTVFRSLYLELVHYFLSMTSHVFPNKVTITTAFYKRGGVDFEMCLKINKAIVVIQPKTLENGFVCTHSTSEDRGP